MKKIYKSFTFRFAITSMAIIFFSLIIDSNNILLTVSNFPLYLFLKAMGFTLYQPNAIDHTFFLQHLLLWFKWHFISFICYGLIIDIIKVIIKNRKTKLNSTK